MERRMNSKYDPILWVDGNLLFRDYLRWYFFWILIILFINIPSIMYTADRVNTCFFLLIITLNIMGIVGFTIRIIEDYKHVKMEQSVFKCEWCKCYFPHEIYKSVVRLLDKRGFVYNIQNLNLEGTRRILREITLPQENAILSFIGPKLLFTKQYPNWIGIGSIKPSDEQSISFVESLKSEILLLMKEMPDTNNFCKQCEGAHNSICYGGTWFWRGHERGFNEILEKIDPFKDEETLHYLIRRKERLKDKKIKKRSDYQDLIDMVQNQ